MKNLLLLTCCFFLLHFGASSQTQDNNDGSLGLPGDNLNLYAVMNLFQESRTLQQFERRLNDENSRINNLDLNGDGRIDYISVVDRVDGRLHTIILKDAISANETQDVAVFYVNKDAYNHVDIQLIGDEALYGRDYIIEPNKGENVNPGYSGNGELVIAAPEAWPIVGLLFLRSYIAWHSPWYYGYYPAYWRPWHPLFWHSYYGYHSNLFYFYEGNFRITSHYRDDHFRDRYYSGRRSFAPSVIERSHEGFYRSTYSHPELRREGVDRFNKMHPDNMNHSGNRPAIQQHNANRPSREYGNRPSPASGAVRQENRSMNERPSSNPNNSRPDVRRENEGARPAMNQHNDNQSARPSGNSDPNRSAIGRATVQPSNNRAAEQPSNNRSNAQPANRRFNEQPLNNNRGAQPSNNQGQRQQGNSSSARPAQPSARPAARSDERPAAAKERKPANENREK
jgi:hypothetical protein